MPITLRPLRSALPAALLALALAGGVHTASAQSGTTIQTPHALGTTLAAKKPYNFVGRVFDLDFFGIASGTQIRRHTVLTAGHVVYEPDLGFTTAATFSRGLYGTNSLSKAQVTSVAALAGYQTAADTYGPDTLQAFAQDLGYLLLTQPSVDEDWAEWRAQPTLLSDPSVEHFVLGYPGSSFDGRTLAYVVPTTPYVAAGPVGSALYENDEYIVEGGMSGGPIFAVINDDPNQRYVVGETTAGTTTTDAEFNASLIRGIDTAAANFLTAAEYTSGLIKQIKISGPKTAVRGTTVTYFASPIFRQASVAAGGGVAPKGAKYTTDRYSEIKIKNSLSAIPALKPITIKKTSNTSFDVTFSNSTALRSGSTITLQAYYNKTVLAPGKSTFTIKIQ